MAEPRPVVKRIKQERLKRGLSLDKLGAIAGYTGGHIWSIEAGKVRPKIDIIEDLAMSLGFTLELKEIKDE